MVWRSDSESGLLEPGAIPQALGPVLGALEQIRVQVVERLDARDECLERLGRDAPTGDGVLSSLVSEVQRREPALEVHLALGDRRDLDLTCRETGGDLRLLAEAHVALFAARDGRVLELLDARESLLDALGRAPRCCGLSFEVFSSIWRSARSMRGGLRVDSVTDCSIRPASSLSDASSRRASRYAARSQARPAARPPVPPWPRRDSASASPTSVSRAAMRSLQIRRAPVGARGRRRRHRDSVRRVRGRTATRCDPSGSPAPGACVGREGLVERVNDADIADEGVERVPDVVRAAEDVHEPDSRTVLGQDGRLRGVRPEPARSPKRRTLRAPPPWERRRRARFKSTQKTSAPSTRSTTRSYSSGTVMWSVTGPMTSGNSCSRASSHASAGDAASNARSTSSSARTSARTSASSATDLVERGATSLNETNALVHVRGGETRLLARVLELRLRAARGECAAPTASASSAERWSRTAFARVGEHVGLDGEARQRLLDHRRARCARRRRPCGPCAPPSSPPRAPHRPRCAPS